MPQDLLSFFFTTRTRHRLVNTCFLIVFTWFILRRLDRWKNPRRWIRLNYMWDTWFSTNSFFNELTQDLVRFIIERKILHVTYTNNVTYALINNGPIKNGRHNDVKMMNTARVAAINATINPIRRKLKTRNLDNASNRWYITFLLQMGALQTQMDKKYHKYTELKEKKRKLYSFSE